MTISRIIVSEVTQHVCLFKEKLANLPLDVVEDMLKLDPGQILWLRENAPLKEMVEAYVRSLGDWFDNNGETFGQTLEWVMNERGECIDGFKLGIEERSHGIVRTT